MNGPELDPDTGRCICCDLPPASCGKTLEQQRAREANAKMTTARNHYTASRHAIYPGTCSTCHEPFNVGDIIRPIPRHCYPPGELPSPPRWVGVLCCNNHEPVPGHQPDAEGIEL